MLCLVFLVESNSTITKPFAKREMNEKTNGDGDSSRDEQSLPPIESVEVKIWRWDIQYQERVWVSWSFALLESTEISAQTWETHKLERVWDNDIVIAVSTIVNINELTLGSLEDASEEIDCESEDHEDGTEKESGLKGDAFSHF